MIKQAEQLNIGDIIKWDGVFQKVTDLYYNKVGRFNYINVHLGDKVIKPQRELMVQVYSGYIGDSDLLEKYLEKTKPHALGSRICLFCDTIVLLEERCPNCGRK